MTDIEVAIRSCSVDDQGWSSTLKFRQMTTASRDRVKSKMVGSQPPTTHASIADDIKEFLLECAFALEYLDNVFSDRDLAIASLIADTGLRPVDLTHLTWKDLLPQHDGDRFLDVSRIEIPEKLSIHTHGKGKTKGSSERITLSDVTRDKLKELLREGTAITDPVFMSDRIKKGGSKKEALTPKSIRHAYVKVKNHFGLKHLTIHALRRHYWLGVNRQPDLDDDLDDDLEC